MVAAVSAEVPSKSHDVLASDLLARDLDSSRRTR